MAGPPIASLTLDPQYVLLAATAAVYLLGSRRTHTAARNLRAQHLRDLAFLTALGLLALALSGWVDGLSAKLFWVHMVQHVMLIMVIAPLILLSRPWVRMWRAVPLDGRVAIARPLSRSSGAAPLRAGVRALGRPGPALALFAAVLLGWHLPFMFDATLQSGAVHVAEHVSFLAVALLLWKHVIPSPPLRAPLGEPQRVIYTIAAMIVSWALAVALALYPTVLYHPYAELASRPGGLSAMADQQIAAGIMWVPGSITFVIVIFAYVHRWLLAPDGRETRPVRQLAGEH